MPDWGKLLANGDFVTLLVIFAIVFALGGGGAAVVTGISARARGIRGDALVKEQNGITGLGKLADSQGEYIDRLEKRIEGLESRFTAEVEYSNLLILTLSSNDVPIPPRPPLKKDDA